MIASILDIRNDEMATCYLAKISLMEYVTNLPLDYQNYDVQREIVSNIYLDNLVDTILSRKHIPPIVLIANNFQIKDKSLVIEDFKILDGLQRTYRLSVIWKTIEFLLEELTSGDSILSESGFGLSRKYSKKLINLDSNTSILSRLIKFHNSQEQGDLAIKALTEAFKVNFQWFEIWTNLTPKEEVEKMLILNAGHKPVKIKHQLEIIFRNILPLMQDHTTSNFKIIREKENPSTQFSKNRQIGEFHFSHLISALISLKEAQPVTTNSALIQKMQNEDFNSEEDSKFFSYEFLTKYISSLITIEKCIVSEFPDYGIRWIGREVALTGIYAAFGQKILQEKNKYFLDIFSDNVIVFCKNIRFLDLKNFEKQRNNMELSKVNIGNVNKTAIYNATLQLINDSHPFVINWKALF